MQSSRRVVERIEGRSGWGRPLKPIRSSFEVGNEAQGSRSTSEERGKYTLTLLYRYRTSCWLASRCARVLGKDSLEAHVDLPPSLPPPTVILLLLLFSPFVLHPAQPATSLSLDHSPVSPVPSLAASTTLLIRWNTSKPQVIISVRPLSSLLRSLPFHSQELAFLFSSPPLIRADHLPSLLRTLLQPSMQRLGRSSACSVRISSTSRGWTA